MTPQRTFSRFGGIDVGKNKHVLCVIDREGKTLLKSQSFANDREGYQRLRQTLKHIGQRRTFLLGMEATHCMPISLTRSCHPMDTIRCCPYGHRHLISV